MAIPILSPAPNIVSRTVTVTQATYLFFKAYGLEANFSSGKTEAIVHFGGPGARKAKVQLFQDGNKAPVNILGKTIFIGFVKNYKHLGTRLTFSSYSDPLYSTPVSLTWRTVASARSYTSRSSRRGCPAP